LRNRLSITHPSTDDLLIAVALAFGLFTFGVVLAFHNLADGDLWAKLALGASVWGPGELLRQDIFAFTPVLPEYVDHEWGAGVLFFGLLSFFGPSGLMVFKIVAAFGALGASFWLARRNGCGWNTLLLLAVPAAAAVLPGYVTVIRSHALTYFFFATTLLCLEEIKKGRNWPAWFVVGIMTIWANVHGGFVAGLGAVMVYSLLSILTRTMVKTMIVTALLCALVPVLNPYGLRFWYHLIPAVLHQRPDIVEWQPMPLFAADSFLGFRILFLLTVCVVVAGWKGVRKSWAGIAMLAITAILAWRSRRHAPFFGLCGLAFAGPYLESALVQLANWFPANLRGKVTLLSAVVALYGVLAIYVASRFLPNASWQVLAPVRQYPVREADILMQARAEGNLAVPFSWGSYAMWRLYPRIKVSIDGRYEAAYPESTFAMNLVFFGKSGANWDRLIREYKVDYVVLDLRSGRLGPEDLRERGYALIWLDRGYSALLALEKHAAFLRKVASELPPTTIEPLDARIPDRWPW